MLFRGPGHCAWDEAGKEAFEGYQQTQALQEGYNGCNTQRIARKRLKKHYKFVTEQHWVSAREKFAIEEWMEVYLVLEEDGTEVDDEEYFQTIEGNTMLMLLLKDDIWSPEGPPYT